MVFGTMSLRAKEEVYDHFEGYVWTVYKSDVLYNVQSLCPVLSSQLFCDI